MITIQVLSADGRVRVQTSAQNASLYVPFSYEEGDVIRIGAPDEKELIVQVDPAVAPAQVFAPTGEIVYAIPSAERRTALPPQAFTGDKHVITARPATAQEARIYRNIALNPADQRGDTSYFPHATANVETRDESVFAARNVIDGYHVNESHGAWPYQSWGIGARTDAYLVVDFGRPVKVDKAVLFLRADFPHDAYWTQATLILSDGTEKTFPLSRQAEPQEIDLGEHVITWIRLDKLIKSDDPSAFPALSELEVYGAPV
jgi:hypothetical protein